MKTKLLFLFAFISFSLVLLPGCKKDVPSPSDFAEPIPGDFSTANLIKGKWLCTTVEENTYSLATGQNIGTVRGESNDLYSFGNSAYSKESSPYRKYIYLVSNGGSSGFPNLYLEEFDKHYSLEITTLNTTNMTWKITFQGNNVKSVKHMYFKR